MNAKRAIRIANCSGFYEDRVAAAKEMVEGGPIDVLTGDYLAELTMLVLWKAKEKDPSAGYVRTFLTQMEQVLGTCMDRGIRIVTNAGGLNPAGLGSKLSVLAEQLGMAPRIAYLRGDDLVEQIPDLIASGHSLANMDTGQAFDEAAVEPITANAYLGGWGIAAALDAGADIVICPRVADAALVVGPAAWWHGWGLTDYDQVAGAVVAGHVIECGPQATGGNYSFLREVTDRRPLGYPVAAVFADGSSVITKHAGTGGLVSKGTVTAQLLYETGDPAYENPDVVAHFDTLKLSQLTPDQVMITGVQGSPPSGSTKVAINYLGGYRNSMTLVLTGLDIDEKASWAEQQLFEIVGGRDTFAKVDTRLIRYERPDAPSNEQATAHLRITVEDPDAKKVGRRFSDATMELALGGYPGFHTTTPPASPNLYGVYWPALVPSYLVRQEVVMNDGSTLLVPPVPSSSTDRSAGEASHLRSDVGDPIAMGATRRVPLGALCGARSGGQGGNAKIGLWTTDAESYSWLEQYLTVDQFRGLLVEAQDLTVRRYRLPNLNALNFVVVGLLGDDVAASARLDPQAKGLGEYIRSRYVDIPESLL
ncbi:MAG: exopolyphosphatase [Nocardia sp.]|uniref:acyclic terpene utilization AtuA family protein n=1 Tax=Nocardia sp. TaxID=1821 RepID=UPI002610B15F|nr:acyclic terpene utilization AtuA family protein [Nocardia sp.]MCU1648813.1 exopolyphosphatase [Nocardia sp.]